MVLSTSPRSLTEESASLMRFFSEGQVVDAKIVDINEETKKVSLSISSSSQG